MSKIQARIAYSILSNNKAVLNTKNIIKVISIDSFIILAQKKKGT